MRQRGLSFDSTNRKPESGTQIKGLSFPSLAAKSFVRNILPVRTIVTLTQYNSFSRLRQTKTEVLLQEI